jgi:heat shock protein HslJ
MKNLDFPLVLCAGLLVLTACASFPSQEGSEKGLTGTVWGLTSLKDQDLVAGSTISALFAASGAFGGSSGCNQYSGEYSVTGSSIRITSPLSSTVMACSQELMDQESAYLEALGEIRSFAVTGDQLTFKDSNDQVLLVYQAQAQDLSGTAWDVTGYNNGNQAVTSVLSGSALTAAFGADGTVAGHSGCNQYSGPYSVNGDQITIGPLASTRKACSDPAGVMEQEAQFLAAMQSANTYKIEGNVLELRTQDGALAVDLTRK